MNATAPQPTTEIVATLSSIAARRGISPQTARDRFVSAGLVPDFLIDTGDQKPFYPAFRQERVAEIETVVTTKRKRV